MKATPPKPPIHPRKLIPTPPSLSPHPTTNTKTITYTPKRKKKTLKPPSPPPLISSCNSGGRNDGKRSGGLPSLSACHACGKRSVSGSPKLKTLASHWRIVLLCPPCFLSLDSSGICSYCFSPVSISSSDGLDCCLCTRRVHRRCLSFSPPHSLPSFTCSDCWLPSPSPPSRAFGAIVASVSLRAQRAASAAAHAREKASRKAAASRCAASRASSAVEALNDKELAIRLHRAINSSPRISRFLGLTPSSLAVVSCNTCTDLDLRGKALESSDRIDVNSSSGFNVVEKLAGEDGKSESRVKEEQGSCSDKVVNSVGDDNGVECRSGLCRKRDGLEDVHAQKVGRSSCADGASRHFLPLRKRRFSEIDGKLKTYCRRRQSCQLRGKKCFEIERNLITYSRRRQSALMQF